MPWSQVCICLGQVGAGRCPTARGAVGSLAGLLRSGHYGPGRPVALNMCGPSAQSPSCTRLVSPHLRARLSAFRGELF